MLRRWDYGSRKYRPYEVPDDRAPVLYCDEMEREVWCARCGRRVQFGGTYTSLQIHDSVGFGYAVCPECHDEEMEDEARWRR